MAVVEELIGRLTLTTKGIKDAKEAVKVMENMRKALQGLAGSARTKLDGPARMAKGFRDAQREAAKLAAEQRKLAAGGGTGRGDAGIKKQISLVKDLGKVYRETARDQALLFRRPPGGSWIKGEMSALRDYARLQKQIGQEASRRGTSRRSIERELGPRMPYGRRDAGGVPGLRNPASGAVDVRGLLDKGFDSATTIPQVQSQMRMRKESEADITRATKLAEKLSGEVKQFTAAEHLQGIYQSLAVFGDMETALKAAPGLAKANALIEGLSDQFTRLKPFKGGTATKDFARVFDLMGVTTDQKKQDALSEAMIKSLEQSSGDVTPSDILQSLKMARSARYGFSPDFLQNYLGGIIGDYKTKGGGGGSAGVAMMSAFTNFHDLAGPKWTLQGMIDAGLLENPEKVARNKKGSIVGRGGASLKNEKLYRENPQQWYATEGVAAVERMYGKLTGDDQEDSGKVLKLAGRIAGNRNAKDQFTSGVLQRDERERDAKITRKMPGMEGLKELDRSPLGRLQQFTAGITEMFAALASPAVEPALNTLSKLGDIGRSIAQFQRENPDKAPVVSGAVGAAGAATATGAAVVGKKLWDRVFGRGGGTTPGSGATPPTTPVEPPGPTSSAARPVVGPQASAMDIAARGLAKATAAASIGPSTSLTRGDQDALIKKVVGGLKREGKIPHAQGGSQARLGEMKIDPEAAKQRLAEMKRPIEEIAEKLQFEGKLTLDTSPLDAALAKIAKVKAELAGLGGKAGGIGGVSAVGLGKSINAIEVKNGYSVP